MIRVGIHEAKSQLSRLVDELPAELAEHLR
jgi:hypothetical protein